MGRGLALSEGPASSCHAQIEERWGIWSIEREEQHWRDHLPFVKAYQDLDELSTSLPFVLRLFSELYQLGPFLLLAFTSMRFFEALLPAYSLRLSARMLNIVRIPLRVCRVCS